MPNGNKSVVDGKLTDEQLGQLYRKMKELEKRINAGTISFIDAMEALQKIIIEGQAAKHLAVIKGVSEIKEIAHLINCDAEPFIPPGFSVEEHKRGGLFKFDPAKGSLYLSEKQNNGRISGHDLRTELRGKPVMNANVLDWLLDHQEFIPEEWKGKAVFFWGTIYRNSGDKLVVRYLYWNGSKWNSHCNWLDIGFDSDNPAALAG